MVKVGVCGVTGYAGYELLRWLRRHRATQVVFTTSESQAGRRLAEVFAGPLDTPLLALDDAPFGDADVVFLALPHGTAANVARRARAAGVRVIDFSADLRLATPEAYKRWYAHDHPAPELLPTPYGIPELYRTALRDAPLIANPGCYPTSVLLGIAPVLRANALTSPLIVIDSKSGVSGAGRPPKQNTHFVEVNESLSPYNIGQVHRHVGEMQQEATLLANGSAPEIVFTPHLLPISRGILSTIYLHVSPDLSEAHLRSLFHEQYAAEPFVRILPAGQLATIAHTSHTNDCVISVTLVRPGLAIIVSSIDNLVKGAAGQALQNMNVMFGIEETEGLR
ncbi:MAG TPA: N-acetyl-gamma-glutamyl-phosphate reductase [Roseiflexaceae bacterium]|nr:N-acetyl-gamma-glutamyl-phosphate reductase [Roseiflexaceae bacterium]HMP42450.1 N-acetyl-gamma-glutamyl-phosphate reductase [Roseiflexaceae bacterium]